jgi:hypothetical protein
MKNSGCPFLFFCVFVFFVCVIVYQSFLGSNSSRANRRRSFDRVRTGGRSAGVRGDWIGVFVDLISCGFGTSDGENIGRPFVDLFRRPGGGMVTPVVNGERKDGRSNRASLAMRCASSGVNRGASLNDMLLFVTCIL